MRHYIALVHKDATSDFGVSFPDFPGAVTAAATSDEAIEQAEEALALHVDLADAHGLSGHANAAGRSHANPATQPSRWLAGSGARQRPRVQRRLACARVPLGPNDPLPDTEDFVTTRILWLDGMDAENANTRDRFIYIHGTKHEGKIGTPDSHGCIRMRNADVIELFQLVDETTQVVIRE